jgi:DEAD/DEAH box helicase domain-containing protein
LNTTEIQNICEVIQRGTDHDLQDLIQRANDDVKRLKAASQNQNLIETVVAGKLAEGGILPMYGMPSNVRNLYFDLRSSTKNSDVALSMDRDFDQAVSSFVPGTVRTWDKRYIKPHILSDMVEKDAKSTQNWICGSQPIGSSYFIQYCQDCLNPSISTFHPQGLVNSQAIKAEEIPNWWNSPHQDILDPITNSACAKCQSTNTQKFIGVAPKAFMSDLVMNRAVGDFHNNLYASQVGNAFTTVNVEDFTNNPSTTTIYNCDLSYYQQSQVYKINRNGRHTKNNLFHFVPQDYYPQPHTNRTVRAKDQDGTEGQLWKTERDPNTASHHFAIVSPKMTDSVGIKGNNTPNIRVWHEKNNDLVYQSDVVYQSAWQSAGVILQRAVAFEMDIDSTDLDVTAVYKFTDNVAGIDGAKMFFSDAHPNGSGVVQWLFDNWSDILNGLIFPVQQSKLNIFGSKILESIQAQDEPDALLKGFRNQYLHHLIDYKLGLDLLAILMDSNFIPARQILVSGQQSPVLFDWDSEFVNLVSLYQKSLPTVVNNIVMNGKGWTQDHQTDILYAIVHPLWNIRIGNPPIDEILSFASQNGFTDVVFVDAFNLNRRMGWVRQNLRDRTDIFRKITLGLQNTITTVPPTTDNFTPIQHQPLSAQTNDGVYKGFHCDNPDQELYISVKRLGGNLRIKILQPFSQDISGQSATFGDYTLTSIQVDEEE